jgi:hypothetical protein
MDSAVAAAEPRRGRVGFVAFTVGSGSGVAFPRRPFAGTGRAAPLPLAVPRRPVFVPGLEEALSPNRSSCCRLAREPVEGLPLEPAFFVVLLFFFRDAAAKRFFPLNSNAEV